MRVWFLKETKTIDINDGLGCNIVIGARENTIYRITARENNDVNSLWIPFTPAELQVSEPRRSPDYSADPRLLGVGTPTWPQAIAIARSTEAAPQVKRSDDRSARLRTRSSSSPGRLLAPLD
jgi:NADH-quinone oxidoreductase subunit G